MDKYQRYVEDIIPSCKKLLKAFRKLSLYREVHADDTLGPIGKLDNMIEEKKYCQELRHLAANLKESTDELRVYSEAVYEGLHSVTAPDYKLTEIDNRIKIALQSRAGSMQLWHLCVTQPEAYNLEMCLVAWLQGIMETYDIGTTVYVLMVEPKKHELHEWTVRQTGEANFYKLPDDVVHGEPDGRLFRQRSKQQIIEVPRHGTGRPAYLRIPKEPRKASHGKLENFADVLKHIERDTKHGSHLFTQEDSIRKTKIGYAFKLVEAGLFLLGTPWFSALESRNLRKHDDFVGLILRTPTISLTKLVSSDPKALDETSQLFRLGILLVEIALATTDATPSTEQVEDDPKTINKLVRVEKAMGAQYFRATAFCLFYRRPRIPQFSRPEKYDENYSSWMKFLEKMLKDYYSQVYLR